MDVSKENYASVQIVFYQLNVKSVFVCSQRNKQHLNAMFAFQSLGLLTILTNIEKNKSLEKVNIKWTFSKGTMD